jgi:hypothetical protein
MTCEKHEQGQQPAPAAREQHEQKARPQAAPKKQGEEKETSEMEEEEEGEEGDEAAELAEKYFGLVTKGGDPKEAQKVGNEFVKAAGKDALMLNQFAWELLTNKEIKSRDLKLALQVAKLAYGACDGQEAAFVDTYARALHDTGKLDEAIKLQKKAVELCQDDAMRRELQATLDGYLKESNK